MYRSALVPTGGLRPDCARSQLLAAITVRGYPCAALSTRLHLGLESGGVVPSIAAIPSPASASRRGIPSPVRTRAPARSQAARPSRFPRRQRAGTGGAPVL